MRVRQVISVLESLAPLSGAAEWDNVGLLVGSADWPAETVLLTIDLTEPVLDEAIEGGAGLIVAYHPPIFRPLQSLTDRTTAERIALRAAAAGVAIYSPHTALDAAPGGVNDWLAAGLGQGDVRALVAHESLPESEQSKFVTFCPEGAAEKIRDGLATVGAGVIGAYTRCSFETRGTGTFHGGEGSDPAVGEAGRLERADEVRLEMVCPRSALGLAIEMLKATHPYEEPPIEIYTLNPRPNRYAGEGRRIVLDQPATLEQIVERIKGHLKLRHVRMAETIPPPRTYGTIGLCAGAGGSLLDAAITQGCGMFFTGEMRHHDVLSAQSRGCTVVLAGHSNTERGYLAVLRERLLEQTDGVQVVMSTLDADPLVTM